MAEETTTPPLAATERKFRFRPRVRALDRAPDVGSLLVALRGREGLCALHSAGGAPARTSLVACEPLRETDGRPAAPGPSIAALRALLARLEPGGGDPPPGPFAGGFLGALAYDLGVAGEALALPPDPWDWPRVAGGLYTDFVVIDHQRGAAQLVLGEDPGDDRPPLAEREARWMAALEERPTDEVLAFRCDAAPRRLVPAAEHRARVAELRERIARGDFYQANLAHPFEAPTTGAPEVLYARLARVNPAPYAGYLALEAGGAPAAIVSASPELLLECDGTVARTRPIKGTVARGATPEEDRARAAALLASQKDRAELAMIVDLERNDLGRVARVGGVRVEGHPSLESHASVHHLAADVVATLAPDRDALDALASLFPGGSISGAPKLASMAAIAALEGHGRGFFTGSLGRLDLRGRACFDILIRTLFWRARPGRVGESAAGEVRWSVGGGITWSSDPAAEDEETLVKGARLAAALGHPAPGGGRGGAALARGGDSR